MDKQIGEAELEEIRREPLQECAYCEGHGMYQANPCSYCDASGYICDSNTFKRLLAEVDRLRAEQARVRDEALEDMARLAEELAQDATPESLASRADLADNLTALAEEMRNNPELVSDVLSAATVRTLTLFAEAVRSLKSTQQLDSLLNQKGS